MTNYEVVDKGQVHTVIILLVAIFIKLSLIVSDPYNVADIIRMIP
jgi:hypothetical protein